MNIFIILICIITLHSCTKNKEYLGKEPTFQGQTLTVSQLLNRNLKQTHVRITGKVTNVCKTEGCWFILQDKSLSIRCVFENPSINMDQVNMHKTMSFEGSLIDQIIDEETAEEYAKQEGRDVHVSGKQRISVFVISTILLEE